MQKSKWLLVVGVVMVALGLFTLLVNEDKNAENLAIAQQSNSAHEAARAIAQNNQKEVWGNSVGMFLLGMGSVVSLAGLVPLFKRH